VCRSEEIDHFSFQFFEGIGSILIVLLAESWFELPLAEVFMSTATISIKRCSSCHKDVTNEQRMKDASGRYWCVTCGAVQQKQKALLAAEARRKSKENGGPGKGRLLKMLVVFGLLAAGAAWSFSTLQ
jgi:hypothetical protein